MSIEKDIALLLYNIARLTQKDILSRNDEQELSFAQLHTIFLITQGYTTMSMLANELQVKLPTVTGLVDRLVKHNYLKRIADKDDRRLVRLELTKIGKKSFAQTVRTKKESLNIFIDNVSRQDLVTIRSILEKLTTNINQAKITKKKS